MDKTPRKINPKMWDMGEWLITFLKKNLKGGELCALAHEAIILLDIDYKISENDISFFIIKHKYSETVLNEEWRIYLSEIPIINHDDFLRDNFPTPPPIDRNNYYLTPITYGIISSIRDFRETILFLLKELLEKKLPWSHTFSDRLNHHYAWAMGDISSGPLIAAYSQLNDSYKATNERLKKVRNFIYEEGKEGYNIFKWDTVIARIFFEFLSLGGQRYYGFCDRCNSFYISQRKGRKRFCSDICRATNHIQSN